MMVGIAFTIIILYHFLTFTCHCDIENKVLTVKKKITALCCHPHTSHCINNRGYMLQIPDRAYDYTVYREGLVTSDFVS